MFADTTCQCISYQLAKHIKVKCREPPYTQQQIADSLLHITEELYEDYEDSPYENAEIMSVGFTAAAMVQLCRKLNDERHVTLLDKKISSFIPEKTEYESVAVHIYADHCYIVGDPSIRTSIAAKNICEPRPIEPTVLAQHIRRATTTPA